MTLNNTLRLNERRLHPTPHIIFIKPLKDRPDSAVAEEFLNRVAAICHPLLKSHHLRVTTLEEFPPNREFCGRNFNAGECIQLVLRRQSRSSSTAGPGSTDNDDSGGGGGGGSSGFLPFRAVVMVMMHELAHNAQMNHSPAFWAVRNEYAAEMRQLWARGYTGEGMWGPGRQAASGIRVGGGRELDGAEMPEHLCGGTYRSRRGRGGPAAWKRKAKPKVDWREQKERRIKKKFGVDGKALGEDVVERMALQGFKGPTNKSRVAGSKRGRELRAAAALARFEKKGAIESKGEKEDEEEGEGQGDSEEGETADEEDEYEYESGQDADVQDAKDIDGTRMKDEHGLGLIRVCEEDDRADDVHVKEEMDELNGLRDVPWHEAEEGEEDKVEAKEEQEAESSTPANTPSQLQTPLQKARKAASEPDPNSPSAKPPPPRDRKPLTTTSTTSATSAATTMTTINSNSSSPAAITCKVCSMHNDKLALLCAACSNVLDARKSPGAWRCAADSCRGGEYLNPADYGVCGVCGTSKMVLSD